MISTALPHMQKDTPLHTLGWLLMHPMWGFGFFVVLNRFVHAEQSWQGAISRPRLVAGFAAIGVFSYSLYLTHELVIMQSWWFVFNGLPAMVNTLLVVTPSTIVFAWLYYLFFEKPFMRKTVSSFEFRVPSGGDMTERPQFPISGSEFPIASSDFRVAGLTLEASAESEL